MRDELIHYTAEALAERADDYEEAAGWASSLAEAERDAVLTSVWPREHGHERFKTMLKEKVGEALADDA
jgi:hypothetical protein